MSSEQKKRGKITKGVCLFEEVDIDTKIAMTLVGVEGREEVTDGETCKTGANDRDTEALLRLRIVC